MKDMRLESSDVRRVTGELLLQLVVSYSQLFHLIK